MRLGLLVFAVSVSVVLVFPSLLPPASYPERSVSLGLEAADIGAVDSTGLVGRYTSIATDSLGQVHISYYDSTNGNLKYATNVDGRWDLSTIDRAGVVGWSTSIAIDADDRIHISYKDATNRDLKYATNAGGGWSLRCVDSVGDVGSSSSIAVDSGGWVHIGYYNSTGRDLKYATNAGGDWSTITLDSEYDVGGSTSIAVDSSDKVHISYSDITHGYLKYATDASGEWVLSTVDSECDMSSSSSIAVDSADKIHIVYYDSTDRDLKYATNAGGTWSLDTVDEVGDVGAYASLALDSSDKAHISYHDFDNYDLKYATNAGGDWANSTIDSYDGVGWYTSIAVNPGGWVHISYYNFSYSGESLKYATFSVLSKYEPAALATGWNLISLPLVNYGYTASTLPGLSFGDMVVRWDSATQTYDRSYIFGISASFSDFDIEPNWAYWVYSSSDRPIEILGYEPAGLQTRLIKTPAGGGWVQVGLATLRTDLWASDLVEMCTTDMLISVHRWNAQAGTYSSFVVGWDMTDFRLSPGDGLWLYVKGDGVLSYVS